MKVGCNRKDYNAKRNIVEIIPACDYITAVDIYKLFVASLRICKKNSFDMAYRFNDFGFNSVDIFHLFNAVSFGSRPWVSTFETILPRYESTRSCHHGKSPDFSKVLFDKKVLKALDAMNRPSCKKLIALSACNLQMQREFLRLFQGRYSSVEKKLIWLAPPQEMYVDDWESKRLGLEEPLVFMFVGTDFFRKGGMETVEVFQELKRNSSYDFKLIIVSSLKPYDYATKTTQSGAGIARDFIRANRSWIDYYPKLSNDEILGLMAKAHIGLLPTYADTYGYSLLEFQASGCPVISTNVRALPEINNPEVGWVIDVPKNYLGEGIYTSWEDRATIKNVIKQGLERAVEDIFQHKDAIPLKARAALVRIKTQHSPHEYARRLSGIYSEAVQA